MGFNRKINYKYPFYSKMSLPILALAVIAVGCGQNGPAPNPTGTIIPGTCDMVNVSISELSATDFGLNMQLKATDLTNPQRVFLQSELQSILGGVATSSSPTSCLGATWCGLLTVGSVNTYYNLNVGQTNVTMPSPNTLNWFTSGNSRMATGVSGYGQFLYYGPATEKVQTSTGVAACIQINAVLMSSTGVLWMPAVTGTATGPTGCDIVSLSVSSDDQQNSFFGTTFKMVVNDLTNSLTVFNYDNLYQILQASGAAWSAYKDGSSEKIPLSSNGSIAMPASNTIQWFTTFKNITNVPEDALIVYTGKTTIELSNSTSGYGPACVYVSAPSWRMKVQPATSFQKCTDIFLNITGHFNSNSIKDMIVTMSVDGPAEMTLSQSGLKKLAGLGSGIQGAGEILLVPNHSCVGLQSISLQPPHMTGAAVYPTTNTIQWQVAVSGASYQNSLNGCQFTLQSTLQQNHTDTATGGFWADDSDPFCVNISGITGGITPPNWTCTDISLKVAGAAVSPTAVNLYMTVDSPEPITPGGLQALALLAPSQPLVNSFFTALNGSCSGVRPFSLQENASTGNSSGASISWSITALAGHFLVPTGLATGPSGCHISISNLFAPQQFSDSVTGGTSHWQGNDNPSIPPCVNIKSFKGAISPFYGSDSYSCIPVSLNITGALFPNSQGLKASMSISGLPAGILLSPEGFETLAQFPYKKSPSGGTGYTLVGVPHISCGFTGSLVLTAAPNNIQIADQSFSWVGILGSGVAKATGAGCTIDVTANPASALSAMFIDGPGGTGPWANPADPFCITVTSITGHITPASSVCDDILVSVSGFMSPSGTGTNVFVTVTNTSNPIQPLSYLAIQEILNINGYSLPGVNNPPADAVRLGATGCNTGYLGNNLINGQYFPITSYISNLSGAASSYTGSASLSWLSTINGQPYVYLSNTGECQIFASGVAYATGTWAVQSDPVCINVTYTGSIAPPAKTP